MPLAIGSRVRVAAAGLNPTDRLMTADADTAARFGLSLPSRFVTDCAGAVGQVGADAIGYAVGDREAARPTAPAGGAAYTTITPTPHAQGPTGWAAPAVRPARHRRPRPCSAAASRD
ncbi:alcohol dehydrogenase catalytic domain-containing protein [Streptomyces sindenensis]